MRAKDKDRPSDGASTRPRRTYNLPTIPSPPSPPLRQQLRLFQHRPCRLLLLVRRIAMLAQNTAAHHTKAGAHVLSNGPINRNIPANRIHQLARDLSQRLVPQHLHRAVVRLQRVVEMPTSSSDRPSCSPRAPASRNSLASSISSSITCAASIARFWYRRTRAASVHAPGQSVVRDAGARAFKSRIAARAPVQNGSERLPGSPDAAKTADWVHSDRLLSSPTAQFTKSQARIRNPKLTMLACTTDTHRFRHFLTVAATILAEYPQSRVKCRTGVA